MQQRLSSYYDDERASAYKIMAEATASTETGESSSLDPYREVLSFSDGFRDRIRGRFVTTAYNWIANQRKNGGEAPFVVDNLHKTLEAIYEQLQVRVEVSWNEYLTVTKKHFSWVKEILEKLNNVTRFPGKKYGKRLAL